MNLKATITCNCGWREEVTEEQLKHIDHLFCPRCGANLSVQVQKLKIELEAALKLRGEVDLWKTKSYQPQSVPDQPTNDWLTPE